jgi:hypothetical protein
MSILEKSNRMIIVAACCLIAVFIIDLNTPLVVTTGDLYVCCILLVFNRDRQTILVFALLATSLIAANYFICYSGKGNLFNIIMNKCISTSAVWMASYLAFKYKQIGRKAEQTREAYLHELEQMLFMTSHNVRVPVANLLTLSSLLKNEDLSKEEFKTALSHIEVSAEILSKFTQELTLYMEQISKDKIVDEK